MTHKIVGNNRVLRKDESGTYYKDIVFVPSGALTMNNPFSSTSTTRKEEDVNEIREVHTHTFIQLYISTTDQTILHVHAILVYTY